MCHIIHTSNHKTILGKAATTLLLRNSQENTQKPRFSVYRQLRSEPEPLWDYYGAQLWSRGCGAT